jgi:hypothetical protein
MANRRPRRQAYKHQTCKDASHLLLCYVGNTIMCNMTLRGGRADRTAAVDFTIVCVSLESSLFFLVRVPSTTHIFELSERHMLECSVRST